MHDALSNRDYNKKRSCTQLSRVKKGIMVLVVTKAGTATDTMHMRQELQGKMNKRV